MKFVDTVPIITAVISLIGSYLVAKVTAKKGIKKIELEQKHELNMNITTSYAILKEKINTYLIQENGKHHREVVSALGNFFACCPSSMLSICKELEIKLINKETITKDFIKLFDEQWQLSQTSNKTYKR